MKYGYIWKAESQHDPSRDVSKSSVQHILIEDDHPLRLPPQPKRAEEPDYTGSFLSLV